MASARGEEEGLGRPQRAAEKGSAKLAHAGNSFEFKGGSCWPRPRTAFNRRGVIVWMELWGQSRGRGGVAAHFFANYPGVICESPRPRRSEEGEKGWIRTPTPV
ncbi:hypothetical protein GCM10009602_38050 [Nocardiopsis tropica]